MAKQSRRNVSKRYRNFAIVFYPESVPENFLEVITDWHVPAFLSPLHDQDQNPDGEKKKAHYHLLLLFDGMKSLEQVQEFSDQLSRTPVEIVASIRGYARYLCHLDNPEKYQYPVGEVVSFAGESYTSVIMLPTDKYRVVLDIISYAREHHVFEYSDMIFFAIDSGKEDWFRVLCDNTVLFSGFFKSFRLGYADKFLRSGNHHLISDSSK